MKVRIMAFGIAKDIVGGKHLELEVQTNELSGVRQELINQFPDFSKLASLRFAVNTNYVDDSYQLDENDEVVLIPPVSGG